MYFDINVFKERYGSLHIKLLAIQSIACVLSVICIILRLSFVHYVAGLIVSCGIITIPLTYCFYIRLKKQSERQRQWLKDGKLYVERVKDSGLTAGGFVDHKETIIFDHINSIIEEKRFFVVKGDIEIISTFNEVTKNKKVDYYKIPINFNMAEKINEIGEY